MCFPQFLPALAGAGATAGTAIQTIGTIVSIGGSLASGIGAARAARAEAASIRQQRETEANIAAVKDQRTRLQFRRAMRQQAAELAARGVSLDSATAVALGESAAQEMSYASQAVRSDAQARDIELTAAERAARGRANSSILKGAFSAAGTLLEAAPDIWPELVAE